MTVTRQFTRHGHVHRFLVERDDAGWEVREEEDAVVLRRAHRHDWHRVERDISLFNLRAHQLTKDGWVEHVG